jgi:hypothetical protein
MVNQHRLYEITGIIAFAGIELAQIWRLGTQSDSAWDYATIALACVVGYVGADFISGLIHWLFDRYGSVDTPVFGPNFVRPFRDHHIDEKGITRHDFIETNGNNCIATAPLLVPALMVPLHAGEPVALFLVAVLTSGALAVFATNQFHKWAHEDRRPPLIDALQRLGLILEPRHHSIHHTPPFDRYYCITTGWLNPLLFRIRFYDHLEALILKLTGVRAGLDDAERLALATARAEARAFKRTGS